MANALPPDDPHRSRRGSSRLTQSGSEQHHSADEPLPAWLDPRGGKRRGGPARTGASNPSQWSDPQINVAAAAAGHSAPAQYPAPQYPAPQYAAPQYAEGERAVRGARNSTQPKPTAVDRAQLKPFEHGLPAWSGLLLLLAIAGIGGAVDALRGGSSSGGFNIAIVVASIAAIVLVKRSAMFWIVIAPPIVYSVASAIIIYARSGGLNDRRVLYDAAANWLVYGFPAIGTATAAVLVIAGVRLIARR